MEKGIVILAFGKRGYYFAAWNLAYSIKKFSPELKIALLHDGKTTLLEELSVFDYVKEIHPEYLYHNGFFNPGKVKVSIPELTPFKHTLFIDGDSLALQSISGAFQGLIEGKEYFVASLIGQGGKSDKIEYSPWATNENIWDFFKLNPDAILPAFQSTCLYFRKCKESQKFYEALKKNFDFPMEKLAEKWGGSMPDELIFSGTAAQFGLLPNMPDMVFFGHALSPLQPHELAAKFKFLTLYGNGQGITKTKIKYIEWYDRLMNAYTQGKHVYKSRYILIDKHANKR